MKEKKVLIYLPANKLKPTGGPLGYNYNLYTQINQSCDEQFSYLETSNLKNDKWKQRIDSIKNKFFRSIFMSLKRAYKYMQVLLGKGNISVENIGDYSAIHFHASEDMYLVRKQLKKYSGKIVFTSHSPMARHKEILSGISMLERIVFWPIYSFLSKMDKYCFTHCDYIIFPCEDAMEPYYHSWRAFDKIMKVNRSKVLYLPTGCNECKAALTKEQVMQKYQLNHSKFIISYVGRHNKVKGYDFLRQLVNCDKITTDIQFLIGGREGPLYAPKKPNWKEIGWTNDPYSLVNSSDLFILPNKETYFDLVLLETLSLGKIVLISDTGGNKYFKTMSSKGIFFFKTLDECVDKILLIKNMSEDERKKLGEENKKMFLSYFSSHVFYINYSKLFNTIILR